MILRGTISGRRVGDPPKDEAEQFRQMPGLRGVD